MWKWCGQFSVGKRWIGARGEGCALAGARCAGGWCQALNVRIGHQTGLASQSDLIGVLWVCWPRLWRARWTHPGVNWQPGLGLRARQACSSFGQVLQNPVEIAILV